MLLKVPFLRSNPLIVLKRLKIPFKYPVVNVIRQYAVKDYSRTWDDREKAKENAYFARKNQQDLEQLRCNLEKRRNKYIRRKILEMKAQNLRLECAKPADERRAHVTEQMCKDRQKLDKDFKLEEDEEVDEELLQERMDTWKLQKNDETEEK